MESRQASEGVKRAWAKPARVDLSTRSTEGGAPIPANYEGQFCYNNNATS